MEHVLQADVDLCEVAERSQDSMPFAPTNAIQAPHVGMKCKSMAAMTGKMAAVKDKMSAMSGKMKAAMKVPGCQKLVHGESARLLDAGKQLSRKATQRFDRSQTQDINDTESTEEGTSENSMSSSEFQSKGSNRAATQEFACPTCDAMGAFTIFGTPCRVDDVHFKQSCYTCQGSCMANAEVIKCMKCKGLGCLGSWRKGDTQFTSDCTACNGKGYLAAVLRSSQAVGSKRGRNDLGWSLVAELKQLKNSSDMENAAKRFGSSGKDCSMAALTEAVDCSPHPSTQMAILKAVAPNVFGDQCVVIELND